MFRRFFVWRARRRQRSVMYGFDKRRFKNIFGAGFFGFLDTSRFWQRDFGKYHGPSKLRQFAVRFLAIVALALLIWAAMESMKAFRLF